MQQSLALSYSIDSCNAYDYTHQLKKLKPDTFYIVCWFGGIVREHVNESIEASYQVIFRELQQIGNELISDDFVTENFLLKFYLTHFNIGQIWHKAENQTCTMNGKINLSVFSLTTSFDESNWCIIDINEQKYINSDIKAFIEAYPLTADIRDRSKLLEIKLDTNQKLFLNNIDFLRKSYKELRYLMIYPYESSHDSIITIKNSFIDTMKSATSEEWQVCTQYESDCIFLGRLKYDPYTQKVIKKLTNQRIKAWSNKKSSVDIPVFYPSVQPWHTDNKIEIKVRGILCNGNIFGLDILYISDPKGPIIEWHSPTPKVGKSPPSIERVIHGEPQLNKQLTLLLDD
ncbi:MAG: hypothetical protein LKF82_14555 [Acinetobacter populi]|jgi:hypothetical protein|uniref:hypothetical protein n=1 Tax=Acinetobacter populi TaxID=1582270 RepID=UPI0023530061|nr:hypothetical protein [Acinetobacter populi]MCH4249020.1 hypothetical protein [Acinetobacter populi]